MHGGTSKEMITDSIRKAKQRIAKNFEAAKMKAKEQKSEFNSENLHVVVFFDEANTTDALEVIKEVMCDRRLNGEPISENIKFAAACNPYRK